MKRLRVFLPIVAVVLVMAFAVVLFRTEPALPNERLDSEAAGEKPAIALPDEGIHSEPGEGPATASPDEQAAYEPIEEPQDELYERVKSLLDRIVDSVSSSSNLHNDLKENADFEELVSMWRPALYAMCDMVAKSHGDGLREYVMAAACARILGVYDDERGIGTDSGVEWFMKYGIFAMDDLHIVDADHFEFMTAESLEKEISLPDGTDRTFNILMGRTLEKAFCKIYYGQVRARIYKMS